MFIPSKPKNVFACLIVIGFVSAFYACTPILSNSGTALLPTATRVVSIRPDSTADSYLLTTTQPNLEPTNPSFSSPATQTELRLIAELSALPRGGFALSPDDQEIAIFHDGFVIELYSLEAGALRWTWEIPEEDRTGNADWLQAIVFSPSGEYIAAGGFTRRLYLLDAVNGKLVAKSETGYVIRKLIFHPTGKKIFAFTEDTDSVPVIDVWDVPSAEKSNLPYLGCAFAISPDGQSLVAFVYHPEEGLATIDLDTGQQAIFAPGVKAPCDLAFSVDGQYLGGEFGGDLKLWRLSSSTPELLSLPWRNEHGASAYITNVFFSAKGTLVLLDSEYMATLWDLKSLSLIARVPDETFYVGFTTSGDRVLTLNKTIRIWVIP